MKNPPKEIDQLRDQHYLEQICGQVFYVEQNIEADIALVGGDRRHITHYETLCEDTHSEMDGIAAFVESHGCHLRTQREIPESFKRSQYKKRTLTDEEKTIMEILSRYYP